MTQSFPKRQIGLAIIGCGRMGSHRARLAAQHAGVRFLALADIDEGRLAALGRATGAHILSTSADEVVDHPDVDAVVVSTPEFLHVEPTLRALASGKSVLVEKPLAMTLEDADKIIAATKTSEAELRVGYSMRYLQRYFVGWDQVRSGAIGDIVGGTARVYNTRANGLAILRRSAEATPVIDVLTYLVDMSCWYMGNNEPVEVVSRGHGRVFREHGFDIDDATWALLTFADGAVMSLGVCYMLPAGFPTTGQSVRFEVFGTDGVLLIDDDHRDQILYTEDGYFNAYTSDQKINLAFLGSRTSGEWAQNTMFGRLANETRAWLDSLTAGGPCHISTATEARRTLAVTLAIEESGRSGQQVLL